MSDGIQVNPSKVSEFAMAKFGRDYTQMVAENAELRAFAEAATEEVEAGEARWQEAQRQIGAYEGLLNEASEARREQEEEIARLSGLLAEYTDHSEEGPKDPEDEPSS